MSEPSDAQACIDKFMLAPVPEDLQPAVSSLINNTDVWNQYAVDRTASVSRRTTTDHEEDGEEDANRTSFLVEQIRSTCADILSSAHVPDPMIRSLLSALDITVEAEWEENGNDLRNLDVNAKVWCPYAVPCGAELRLLCQHRQRTYISEFSFDISWRKLLTVDSSWVELGKSCYQECPKLNYKDVDEKCWKPVLKIDSSGFTPANITSLLTAVFGDAKVSASIADNATLLLFCLSGVGAIGLSDVGVNGGYEWSPSVTELEKMRGESALAADDTGDDLDPVSWVEYAARSVAGGLRPTDKYYVPYDEAAAKRAWGESVLERADLYGLLGDEEDAEDVKPEDVWANVERGVLPWK